jgi:hypothetical protein
MLIPIMGKERISVESRPLEEQVYKAMATLFGQSLRECTVRLVGSKAPVAIRTPLVEDALVYPSRVREYVREQMARLSFALSAPEALKRLREREAGFAQRFSQNQASLEPTRTRRRIR